MLPAMAYANTTTKKTKPTILATIAIDSDDSECSNELDHAGGGFSHGASIPVANRARADKAAQKNRDDEER